MKNTELEILNRIGLACKAYYNQPIEYTPHNFTLWIESLNEPMKSVFKSKGLENCIGMLNYRRFLLELSDLGMAEYLRQALSKEDFEFWEGHGGA